MPKDFPLPSNRSFGTLFTVVFALLAGLAWWKGSAAFGWLAATIESGHDGALVLGLAWPGGGAPAGLHLATVEVAA